MRTEEKKRHGLKENVIRVWACGSVQPHHSGGFLHTPDVYRSVPGRKCCRRKRDGKKNKHEENTVFRPKAVQERKNRRQCPEQTEFR